MIGFCDCCNKGPRALSHGMAYGIETYYCRECAGETIDPEDQAEVDAEYAAMQEALEP